MQNVLEAESTVKQKYARECGAKEICFYLSNKCPIKLEWFGYWMYVFMCCLCTIIADAWTHVVDAAVPMGCQKKQQQPTLLLTIPMVEGKKAISQKIWTSASLQ